jgi:hypothetical protein
MLDLFDHLRTISVALGTGTTLGSQDIAPSGTEDPVSLDSRLENRASLTQPEKRVRMNHIPNSGFWTGKFE